MSRPELLHVIERGSGSPLLLVHGLMVTGETFAPVMDRLAARHRVIVPDLRGHGGSRGLPPPYTAARLAADLAHLLDHLGVPSAAVLGYSQGGAIAQQLALDHPGRCARLALVCTYAFNMATWRERIEGHLTPLLLRTLGMRRFARVVVSLGMSQLGKERRRWLAELLATQDGEVMAAAWRAAMAFDSRARLGEIRCPTLVVAAAEDQAVPLHHARLLHAGIADARLVVIDGADNALLFTRPDALLAAVEEFLG